MSPKLAILGLIKTYQHTRAVDGITLEVPIGELVALGGPNGAGKSTLLKLISGIVTPDAGSVRVDNMLLKSGDVEDSRKHGVAIVLQDNSICPDVSVLENLFLGAEPHTRLGLLKVEEMRALVSAVLIRQYSLSVPDLAVSAGLLSEGQKKTVALGRALLLQPKLLLLDEPTMSLSVKAQRHLLKTLQELSRAGVTIVFCTHSPDEILLIAQRVIVLQHGSLYSDRSVQGLSRSDVALLINGEPCLEI